MSNDVKPFSKIRLLKYCFSVFFRETEYSVFNKGRELMVLEIEQAFLFFHIVLKGITESRRGKVWCSSSCNRLVPICNTALLKVYISKTVVTFKLSPGSSRTKTRYCSRDIHTKRFGKASLTAIKAEKDQTREKTLGLMSGFFWAALGTLRTHRTFGVVVGTTTYRVFHSLLGTQRGKLLAELPFWDFRCSSLMMRMNVWCDMMKEVFLSEKSGQFLCAQTFNI